MSFFLYQEWLKNGDYEEEVKAVADSSSFDTKNGLSDEWDEVKIMLLIILIG
ncbi:hypothetical protein [Filifactor alocis]